MFFIFTLIPGEDSQFDEHFFQGGWFNHQLAMNSGNICQPMSYKSDRICFNHLEIESLFPRHPNTFWGIWSPKIYQSNTIHLRRYVWMSVGFCWQWSVSVEVLANVGRLWDCSRVGHAQDLTGLVAWRKSCPWPVWFRKMMNKDELEYPNPYCCGHKTGILTYIYYKNSTHVDKCTVP